MQTPTTPAPRTGLLSRLPGRGGPRGNPVFYADELRLELAGEPDRLAGALTEPGNVDLLTWNVFASLDTHSDRDYLGYRLQSLGGSGVIAPVRLSLWTGRTREPLLTPNPGFVAEIRRRAATAGGGPEATRDFERPTEVPVRIESANLLVLVDTYRDRAHSGVGGRDRLVELVDAGLDQARRVSKDLAVAVVYPTGTPLAADLSARINRLRDPAALAAALPHRPSIPPVVLREVPWQQLLRIWQQEIPFLRLSGQPVRPFLQQLRTLGLI